MEELSSVVDLWHFGTDPGIRTSDQWQWIGIQLPILLFSSLTFKTPTKNYLFSMLFCVLLLEGTIHLHNFSKRKSSKEFPKQKKSRFFLPFLLMIEGSGSIYL
jgi:hypothetical protein